MSPQQRRACVARRRRRAIDIDRSSTDDDAGVFRLGAARTSACRCCSRAWSTSPLLAVAREDGRQAPRPSDAPFSAFVFKVQANMDPAHRDRIASCARQRKVRTGMVVTHDRTVEASPEVRRTRVRTGTRDDRGGMSRRCRRAGQRRRVRVGDTLWVDELVTFPSIPSFAPEHFAVVRCRDAGKYKQFRGASSSSTPRASCRCSASDLRGDQAPGARGGGAAAVRRGAASARARVRRALRAGLARLRAGAADRREGDHRAGGRPRGRGADPTARRRAARAVRR